MRSATKLLQSINLGRIKLNLSGKVKEVHEIWLRDHCRCAKCFHPITKQRLDSNYHSKVITFQQNQDSVKVQWDDGHESEYSNSMFERTRPMKSCIELWDNNLKAPTTPYEEVMSSDEGLKHWLANIQRFGVGFVSGVPVDVQKTKELGERVAFIRHTHYGGFWDFTANLEHGDTAYTNLALGAHTDTTYFSDPIGLQFFHLIHHKGEGGESLYVDGFAVAEELRRTNRWAYDALSTIKIMAHSAGDSNTLIQPMEKFSILKHIDGQLVQVRYNNDDRSLLDLDTEQVELFYTSLHEWQRLLKSGKFDFWKKLTPGTAVMVDNWRVLHGRSAFTGERRMIGSYHSYDDYQSKLKTLLGVNIKYRI